jgi:UDP-N-acetylmuramate dehydrogenase
VSGALERAARVLGERARRDWPLGPLTTYRVGGKAAVFVEAGSLDDLRAVHCALSEAPLPLLVLGRGSNLLVGDSGFAGIVVALGGGFSWLEIEGEVLRAGGAASYPVVARRSARAGLRGMEWAVGVPGSVGGGVRMNAGGHGSSTAEILRTATVFDLATGELAELASSELELSYRHSSIRAEQVVTEASFRLRPGDSAEAELELASIVRWRRENQPGGQNAGSVFTNPPDDSAGRLVEAAGLKGHRVGSAAVSAKHANFIQADSGGSADDVIRLIGEVRRIVAERTGVLLDLEVRVVADGVLVEEAT